jgi:hypothetical protein
VDERSIHQRTENAGGKQEKRSRGKMRHIGIKTDWGRGGGEETATSLLALNANTRMETNPQIEAL